MILLRGLISNVLLERLPAILPRNPDMVIALNKKLFEIRCLDKFIIPDSKQLDIRDIRSCFGLTERYLSSRVGRDWVISEGASFKQVNSVVEALLEEDILTTPPESRKDIEEIIKESVKEKGVTIKEKRRNKPPKTTKKNKKGVVTKEKPQNKPVKTLIKKEITERYKEYLHEQGATSKTIASRINRLQAVLDLEKAENIDPANLMEIDYQELFLDNPRDYWKSILEEAQEVNS